LVAILAGGIAARDAGDDAGDAHNKVCEEGAATQPLQEGHIS
jgi:hypothetical protein